MRLGTEVCRDQPRFDSRCPGAKPDEERKNEECMTAG